MENKQSHANRRNNGAVLHSESIMDYSIHNTIEAGFNAIIFVIGKDSKADFRE